MPLKAQTDDEIPTATFVFPTIHDIIPHGPPFTVSFVIAGGNFLGPSTNFFAAPSQTNSRRAIPSVTATSHPEPSFAFTKPENSAAVVNGDAGAATSGATQGAQGGNEASSKVRL
jgi:hypothetical protein